MRRQRQFDPLRLPYTSVSSIQPAAAPSQHLAISVDLPDEIGARLRSPNVWGSPRAFLQAAFLFYLARLDDVTAFTIAFRPVGAFVSFPQSVRVNICGDLGNLIAMVEAQLSQVHSPMEEASVRGSAVSVGLALGGEGAIPGTQLTCLIRDDGSLQWLVDPDALSAEQVARMTQQFVSVLEGLLCNPARPLCEISLLDDETRHQMLYEWNRSSFSFPDGLLHELVEAQAARTPDALALMGPSLHAPGAGVFYLSYKQLEEQATSLAGRLRMWGVGPEVLVGVCLERSVEMVVALLAILKAGGAYLPLDPAFPSRRLAYMLEDACAPLLLSQNALRHLLPDTDVRPYFLDEHESPSSPRDGMFVAPHPDNLAYVLYTSGSTGQPKGVQVPHRTITYFIHAMQHLLQRDARDVMLAVTTLGFDIAALELFLPLSVGASVAIASADAARDGVTLRMALERFGATMMQATPATWRMMIAAGWSGDPSLTVLCGGEALSPDLADRLIQGNHALWNLYGPTETTVWSSVLRVEAGQKDVPLGRPLPNTHLYVVDRCFALVPIGVPGELYIGGAGVARGYWGQPAQTAERFVPDPFSGMPGARLYRTGDLVAWRADGTLDFLGRVDHQVKVRGYRIELGEIEQRLREHTAVRDGVVMLRDDSSGERSLVAYVVPETLDAGSAPAEQTSTWQEIWERTYSRVSDGQDPAFDTSGWISSYTGLPFPKAEVREWVDHTVARIGMHQPRRVLELGCGTGMLLFQLAPMCEDYVATDITESAVVHVAQQVARAGESLHHVTILHQPADQWEGLLPASFDAVILNSVIQYFPTVEYLLRVLEEAIERVASGGIIFVGDVRSLPLLEAFHTSVLLSQASDALPVERLRQQVQRHVAREEGLLLDSRFFYALPKRFPRIRHVDVQLKRGHAANENVRFRYDVTLYVGDLSVASEYTEAFSSPPPVMDWQGDGLTVTHLSDLLAKDRPPMLVVRGIPNARLMADVMAVQCLAAAGLDTVAALREKVKAEIEVEGVEPEVLWSVAEQLGYELRLYWSNSADSGVFDACFCLSDVSQLVLSPCYTHVHDLPTPLWNAYANNPLAAKVSRELIPALRDALQATLPDYMIPARFVFLDALPLTPNGKVDRRALPAPDLAPLELAESYQPPRTPVEGVLVSIWQEVLGLERIGVEDSFLELGGHSLLATQVLARIRDQFAIQLPLRTIFEAPTVTELAGILIRHERKPGQVAAIAALRQQVSRLSSGEVRELLHKRRHSSVTDGSS